MFNNCSHLLAPLTTLVGGKGPLQWQAFVQMKAAMAHDAFLRYHEHYKLFHLS
jgi:hypothetical protein